MDLISVDREIFIFLNKYHPPSLDYFMFAIHDLVVWVPVVLLSVYIYVSYKQNRTRPHILIKTVIFSTFLLLQLLLCTLILPGLIDPLIHRERPLYDPIILESIDFSHMFYEENLGFYSSKICAVSAVAVFFLSFRATKTWLKVLLVIWVLFVCYNRIYIGAHYPFNILISNLLGIGIGMVTYHYYRYLNKHVMII